MLRIITWNVNGWNAMMKKSYFYDMVSQYEPDILCLQEIKLNRSKSLHIEIDGYDVYENIGERGGYSGTAILYKKEKVGDVKLSKIDFEGRVCVLKTDRFNLINVYTPNSGKDLVRLKYRVNEWDPFFAKDVIKEHTDKHLIVVGDLNVARTENDIANPKSNLRSAGFTIEERDSFEKLLIDTRLQDVWRLRNPNVKNGYTYWSYMGKARERNKGWRIDYVLSDDEKLIKKIEILSNVLGSDHAPIYFEI